MRVGLFVDPDYQTAYQVDVQWLDVWSDADRDGLSDVEEKLIGTSPVRADSDGDGFGDWLDLLPLNPAVGAMPLDLFCNASASHTATRSAGHRLSP